MSNFMKDIERLTLIDNDLEYLWESLVIFTGNIDGPTDKAVEGLRRHVQNIQDSLKQSIESLIKHAARLESNG